MNTNTNTSLSKQYQIMVDETNIVSKTDLRGIITYVNSKFIDISGYTKDELIGKPHNIVRNPENPSSMYKDLWDTIQAKKVWHGQVSNIRKDGTIYVVDASIFPILDSSGKIIEYISIRHDITKLLELSNRLEKINKYTSEQEHLAKEKVEAGIVNELGDECNVLFLPSDILSGDFYSIYKLDDGSIYIYLIDGQGHGISPALTVFAISSLMNHFIHQIKTLDEIISRFYPIARNFLAEFEQLSYTAIMISPDKKSITYSSGGMYPFIIKKGKEIIKVKANNTPFMNFSEPPISATIEVGEWDSLVIYSDGIIEHEHKDINKYSPENIIMDLSNIKEDMKLLSSYDYDDDITLICLENS